MLRYFGIIFGIIFYLTGCSSIHSIKKNDQFKNHSNDKNNNQSSISENINKDLSNEKKIEAPVIVRPPETIRLGAKGGEVYIPSVLNAEPAFKKMEEDYVINLGPGHLKSILHLQALKEWEKQGLKVSAITGVEMGAVMAALYASGMTLERIEWAIFKFFKGHQKKEISTDEWRNEIGKELLLPLKDKNIENFKTKYFIFLYDHTKKKIVKFSKGNAFDLLMLHLRPFHFPRLFKTGESYSGFDPHYAFIKDQLKLVSEVSVGFNLLGTKDFKKYSNECYQLDYCINFSNVTNKTIDDLSNIETDKLIAGETAGRWIMALKKKRLIK